jgi:hypothetical protein
VLQSVTPGETAVASATHADGGRDGSTRP